MIRAKLLPLLVLSASLLFVSCSDLTSSDDDSDNGDEPIEPTATVNNPSDGETVEDDITLTIGGEAENGFSELRIFVGEEEVESVSDPSMPYEHTIATYQWDNGDYDLRAELDVAEEDTSVEASISTMFENYFVEFQTDGYIASLSENTDATYLFIADPDGNVLREVELTSRSDGNIQLLPPSAIEGEVPEQFSITVGEQTTDNDGNQNFNLATYVGFEAWSNVSRTVTESSGSTDEGEIPVKFSNYPQDFPPYFNVGQDANYGNSTAWILSPVEKDTLPISNSSNELLLTALPSGEDISRYYLEESLQDSLSGPNSLRVDVTNDMQALSTHTVSIPSGYSYASSIGFIQGEQSFEETSYFFFDYGYPYGESPAADEVLVGAPDVDGRTVGYHISLADDNRDNVEVGERIGGQETMPSSFDLLDGSVEITNNSLDDLQLNISGSSDYVWVFAENFSTGNSS